MKQAILTIARLIATLWLAFFVNNIWFNGELDQYGIKPRDMHGLIGVVFCPLLHADAAHLLNNTVGLASLGLLAYRSQAQFWMLTVNVAVLGGLGTWATGYSHSVVIGASIILYGYLGYLLAIGVFERSPAAIALSLVSFFLFSGMIYGVLPSDPHISWQGHLFGFIAGIVCARPNALEPLNVAP